MNAPTITKSRHKLGRGLKDCRLRVLSRVLKLRMRADYAARLLVPSLDRRPSFVGFRRIAILCGLVLAAKSFARKSVLGLSAFEKRLDTRDLPLSSGVR